MLTHVLNRENGRADVSHKLERKRGHSTLQAGFGLVRMGNAPEHHAHHRAVMLTHVLNRENGRADVSHKLDDYLAFVNLMRESNERLPMGLVGYCLLTNHFQLLLWPHEDGDLSR